MRIKEFITICLLLVSVSLFAQEKTIEVTGVVTDMNKEPLVGVNVTVKDKISTDATRLKLRNFLVWYSRILVSIRKRYW